MNSIFSLKGILSSFVIMTTLTTALAQNYGVDIKNLDRTMSPKQDFYQYACGGWMLNHPLTGEYARFGSFDMLAENNRKQLKGLITEIAGKTAAQGTVEQKIGDLYRLAMDSARLNLDGFSPVQPTLKKIALIKSIGDLSTLLPELLMMGVDPFFSVYVDADAMNSSKYLVQTHQGGISLHERDYYLENDEHTKSIRDKYKLHVVKMFQLFGYTATRAQKNMEVVLQIETRLATAAYDKVKLRDPHANYNKMTVKELQKMVPVINWKLYFETLGLKKTTELSVSQKESLIEVGKIIESMPLAAQIAYLQWKVIDESAAYLSDAISAQNFEFYGKTLSGKKEQKPRWKRAVASVDGSLGEAVGQMYVKKYFPAEAKERMLKLVNNLQVSLGERIKALEWMGDSTKSKATEKLNSFIVKIGYPDKWRDYSLLDIKKDSYYANIQRANRFEYAYMVAKAGKVVDKTEWLMTPQTVNAYYNPSTNEICFPAGILQYPFFDMNADDAFNYGAIGVVIGHEMTHGFDDQGRQFDKDGNLKDWWTAEDGKKFDARAAVMSNFFDSIQVAPYVKANGKFTLGENIADHGGLQISYQAFKKASSGLALPTVDSLTPEQRFFLSYANVWANNIRPEEILVRTKSDPHSLGKWRVNGALPHIAPWYEAFGIKAGDVMFVPVEKRVSIW